MMSRRRRAVPSGAALFIALASISLGTAGAAEAPTRPEYVRTLEEICKPGSEATQRAVRGTRRDVRDEQLARAARKVARAERIFARTVDSISPVTRPIADRSTLSRWFAKLAKEELYLARTAAALRADDVARFQREFAEFVHQGNKANNVVVSFGFNYCSFRPSRFT
jgi:hypothetical protein